MQLFVTKQADKIYTVGVKNTTELYDLLPTALIDPIVIPINIQRKKLNWLRICDGETRMRVW
jgi:hypothetical protein